MQNVLTLNYSHLVEGVPQNIVVKLAQKGNLQGGLS